MKDVTFFLGRVRTAKGCSGFNFFRIVFKHVPLIVVVSIYLNTDKKLILDHFYYFGGENIKCV